MEQNQKVRVDLKKLVGKRILINQNGLVEVILREISPSGKFIKFDSVEEGTSEWFASQLVDVVEFLEIAEDAVIREELETIEA